MTKKELRRRRSEFITERAKILKPLEQSIFRTENDIEKNEKKLAKLNSAMQSAAQESDGVKIAELARSIHQCRSNIDRLFDELEKTAGFFEEQQAILNRKRDEYFEK